MRRCLCLWMLMAGLAWADDEFTHGQFAVTFDRENAGLPASIRWVPQDIELLTPELGLNLSFTSFEFRSKYYREENRNAWKTQSDPRFVTDVGAAETTGPEKSGDFSAMTTRYASSYALVTRQVFIHDSEPRLRLAYALTMTRDVVVHEAGDLAIHLRFGEGFDSLSVVDPRSGDGTILTQTGMKGVEAAASVLLSGPRLVTQSGGKAGILAVSRASGDLPDPPPVRLLTLPKGASLSLAFDLVLAAGELAPLRQQLREAAARQPAWQRPYAMVEIARLLDGQDQPQAAEAALLEAARLNEQYAVPFAILAAIRRDRKLPGESAAWAEGGWRNPYNYGYSLSAGGYGKTPGLTEEQRRLHSFNLLIAVENCVFYPDYYVWAARDFEARQMVAQACAMYRQALWAVDYMPRTEEIREKTRLKFQKKIAELEQRMLGRTITDLPEQTPLPAVAAP